MAEDIADRLPLTRDDRVLLTAAQTSFPLVQRPFAALGDAIGQSEESVIARLSSLKEAGFLRRIGPVLEPKRFGLTTELVAAEVAPSELPSVGAEVAAWPPVTHCYAREHRINLWFAAVAPGEDWFEWAAARTVSLPGVKGAWRLPALRRFKIAVRFDLTAPQPTVAAQPSPAGPSPDHGGPAVPLAGPPSRKKSEPVDLEFLRAAETDLPLCSDPFSVLAASLQISADDLLDGLKSWLADGRVRRYGALANHRLLGFTANSMTLWTVPDDQVESVGRRLAAFPQVSHCYERPAFPGFPYNLYAMIHGQSRAQCLAAADELSAACEAGDPVALFSNREFKKTAPSYAELLAERAAPDQS